MKFCHSKMTQRAAVLNVDLLHVNVLGEDWPESGMLNIC